MPRLITLLPILLLIEFPAHAAEPVPFPPPAQKLLKQPDSYFPTAVWLQSPGNALKYKQAGINLFVALHRGPTDEQLSQLHTAGMFVICHQNDLAIQHPRRDIILAWMHGDEPDNAQSRGRGQGYGPPIPPAKIIDDYTRIASRDPEKRPVFLNLGQGVAWDNWIGRGVRTRHPEDYPQYLKGCDIASFDIYPAVHDHPEVAGKLEFVARGVDRLRTWSAGGKPLFACIETTRISNPNTKPTPAQIKAEVWMAIIHGASGILYFCHEFTPQSREAGLLAESENLAAVTAINQQLHELAPVLNAGQPIPDAKANSVKPNTPIALLARQHDGSTYLFTVNLSNTETTATFTLPNLKGIHPIDPLGEERIIAANNGSWTDTFTPYAVHLYKLAGD